MTGFLDEAGGLPDGGSLDLPDGRTVHVGRRHLREGARVAVLHLPGLFRFDVTRQGDTFSFAVRNLRGGEQSQGEPFDASTYRPDDGPAVSEYTFGVGWVEGPQIRVVARMPPYDGSLASDCVAFAIVDTDPARPS